MDLKSKRDFRTKFYRLSRNAWCQREMMADGQLWADHRTLYQTPIEKRDLQEQVVWALQQDIALYWCPMTARKHQRCQMTGYINNNSMTDQVLQALSRFAIYRKQTLSAEESEELQKKKNNNIYYYFRLEIEETNILKSWKVLRVYRWISRDVKTESIKMSASHINQRPISVSG